MQAPSEEAKKTAVQIRAVLCKLMEYSIESRWDEFVDGVEGLAQLAEHCRRIEQSFANRPEEDDG